MSTFATDLPRTERIELVSLAIESPGGEWQNVAQGIQLDNSNVYEAMTNMGNQIIDSGRRCKIHSQILRDGEIVSATGGRASAIASNGPDSPELNREVLFKFLGIESSTEAVSP